MDEWSIGFYQDKFCGADINHYDHSLVNGVDIHEVKLRCVFNKVLSVFQQEFVSIGCIRPIPVLLDCRCVDLFKLFCLVIERGGYDSVSKHDLWVLIAEELGFDARLSAAVKLIYASYINQLEMWWREICPKMKSGSRVSSKTCGNFISLALELETEFRDLLLDWFQQKTNDANVNGVTFFNVTDVDDDEKTCCDNGNDRVRSHGSSVIKDDNLCKRKRESLPKMLDWVNEVARKSDDPAVGVIPPPSKWKDHGDEELWMLAIRAREDRLQRKYADSVPQEKDIQKMHPSMYEDSTTPHHQSTDILRCSKRLGLPTPFRSHVCSCCSPPSTSQCKVIKEPTKPTMVIDTPLTNPKPNANESTDGVLRKQVSVEPLESTDGNLRKHVPIGPLFQAMIPEWTGVALESETRWLRTILWPLENENENESMSCIGKGRSEFCSCRNPGSVECVRFHIAENRMKLKRELGSVFYYWKFDKMGEEVSLKWSLEEEKTFKDIVRSNPSRFWDVLVNNFPMKKRADLVSYYFNAYLIKRRSYQNRVTPKDIDSDNEESKFGSIGESFGYETLKGVCSDSLTCSENFQCLDLE